MKNKVLVSALIFLTEALKEPKVRRFVESSTEASKNLCSDYNFAPAILLAVSYPR
jgi:hypothetical protein